MPQALIFDVDGTLAETEELHRAAFNGAFRRLGLDWHWDRPLYGELLRITGGKERIRHFVSAYRPGERPLAEAQVGAIHALKTERYASLLQEGTVAFRRGVVRLIAEARSAGVRLAIATTTSRPNVIALLGHGMPKVDASRFDVIAAGDEVARKKPWPDIYDLVVRQLGVPTSDCIAIEDSANGVLSARRAGVAVVATPSIYTANDDFSAALATISDLGEPNRPFRHIGGAGSGEEMVTLAALERWRGAAPNGPVEGRLDQTSYSK